MLTDVGEYIVGAYLQVEEGCDFVDYNIRPPGGGLEGLGELDVVGLNFKTKTAFVCEVTTHIRGVLYKNNQETVERIKKKHERQKKYASENLSNFKTIKYQFWSPVVPRGYITEHLEKISGLELVINGEYKKRILLLRDKAREMTHDAKNPVFRVLQILEHLRD
ncbi:hypothetical protein FGKAn22_08180 [Ferrigenium kumadai]|uniref:Uncharacterized protein n=1 Tax=Ferrigenium kumadai TaxID=1682490 RepID=A0AAN1VZB2_9PROT|nr:hypothetical protein [Ferrigenium kumadai]BBI99125.1 hypothetical protein FGKAn22_08180 [Ferrigenium kumadai]